MFLKSCDTSPLYRAFIKSCLDQSTVTPPPSSPLRIKKGQTGEANEFTSAIFHPEQKQKCRSEEIAKEYLLIHVV